MPGVMADSTDGKDGKAAQSKAKQLPVFITAGDIDQITTAVTWAIEKKLKPVIVGGRDSPLCAVLLKRHDVPVIVLGTHAVPRRTDADYDEAYTLPAPPRGGDQVCDRHLRRHSPHPQPALQRRDGGGVWPRSRGSD